MDYPPKKTMHMYIIIIYVKYNVILSVAINPFLKHLPLKPSYITPLKKSKEELEPWIFSTSI